MAAFAYVRQYFLPEGIENFHQIFPRHRIRVAQFAGFRSLRHLLPLEESNSAEIVTLLEFETPTQMLIWRASEDHECIRAEYSKCWLKPPEMLLYSSDD